MYAVETFMRIATTQMGSSAALCPSPIGVATARDYGVPGAQSQAWRIGRAIASCRQKKYALYSNYDMIADADCSQRFEECSA